MTLTGDGHVHTEWSWDTGGPQSDACGRMEAMCHRAMQIGLPALAFTWPAENVIRRYLAELVHMVSTGDTFAVVSHIEYAARYWPVEREGPFDPKRFEEEFRHAMRVVAGTGRTLELNIGGPIRPWIPQWWREEGGRAITIASDAHTPDRLGSNFYEAMAMAEHFGFRPGRRPQDFWTR